MCVYVIIKYMNLKFDFLPFTSYKLNKNIIFIDRETQIILYGL